MPIDWPYPCGQRPAPTDPRCARPRHGAPYSPRWQRCPVRGASTTEPAPSKATNPLASTAMPSASPRVAGESSPFMTVCQVNDAPARPPGRPPRPAGPEPGAGRAVACLPARFESQPHARCPPTAPGTTGPAGRFRRLAECHAASYQGLLAAQCRTQPAKPGSAVVYPNCSPKGTAPTSVISQMCPR